MLFTLVHKDGCFFLGVSLLHDSALVVPWSLTSQCLRHEPGMSQAWAWSMVVPWTVTCQGPCELTPKLEPEFISYPGMRPHGNWHVSVFGHYVSVLGHYVSIHGTIWSVFMASHTRYIHQPQTSVRLTSLAAFHVGPSWAPVGPSWAPVGPRLGLTGAHLGMLLGMSVSQVWIQHLAWVWFINSVVVPWTHVHGDSRPYKKHNIISSQTHAWLTPLMPLMLMWLRPG